MNRIATGLFKLLGRAKNGHKAEQIQRKSGQHKSGHTT